VKRNKGTAGIDGMSVDELPAYLSEHWPTIEAQLLAGTYKPQPVRRVEIPKASGGLRPLGIPTVLDRSIQQAVMQVLQAQWDETFSETSFGFRPGRSAHREFNQDASGAKKAARRGPVFITDRGRPAPVLLTIEDYRRLAGGDLSLVDALAQPDGAHFDFKPPRIGGFAKPADLA
jgi:hypothetical protein